MPQKRWKIAGLCIWRKGGPRYFEETGRVPYTAAGVDEMAEVLRQESLGKRLPIAVMRSGLSAVVATLTISDFTTSPDLVKEWLMQIRNAAAEWIAALEEDPEETMRLLEAGDSDLLHQDPSPDHGGLDLTKEGEIHEEG